MNELEEFISEFEDVNISLDLVEKKAKEFYLISSDLKTIINSCSEEPHSAGILLGDIKHKKFKPKPYLLNLISKQTNNKLIINEKTAWLFICGRDIFSEGVIENINPEAKTVLVLNEKEEVLGVAKKDRNRQYKNYYDLGDFIRTRR